MLRHLLLLAALLGVSSAVPPPAEPAPFVRVARGAARLQQGRESRALGPLAGEVGLDPGPAALEAGASTELELSWRGRASARIAGPAHLALTGEPRLRLTNFQAVELEVRRGTLRVEAVGFFEAELSAGALHLGALPGGAVEVLNRGGQALELQPAGGLPSTTVAPGQRLRLQGR